MKYGILYNKNNINVGDDIQAYATARFLPSVDYFIDREHIDEFESKEDEPVAVIMNAWYMWAKWNWPPSKYIVPKMIGFHYADHQLAKQPGTPFKYEFLTGIGGEYLKAYGPVGCRDEFTMNKLQEMGIDAYFSGCITLTLEKQKELPNKGSYICLVDLEEQVTKRMKETLADQDIEVRVITHNRERNAEIIWEDREREVVDLLTMYQNARCVVTKRLHCALPCLAMGVPVFVIKEMEDDIRFEPYYNFLYRTTVTKFMNGEYSYDFMNPPANKPDYIPVREGLIKASEEFVKEMGQTTGTVDELYKPTYTQEDVIHWRHDVMKAGMDMWQVAHRDALIKVKNRDKTISKLRTKNKRMEEKLIRVEQKNKDHEQELKELKAKLAKLETETPKQYAKRWLKRHKDKK